MLIAPERGSAANGIAQAPCWKAAGLAAESSSFCQNPWFCQVFPCDCLGTKKASRSLSRRCAWKDESSAGMGFPFLCNLRADGRCRCHLWDTGSSHCSKKRVLHQLEETASPQQLGYLHKGRLPMETGIRVLPPHTMACMDRASDPTG